MNKIGCWLLKDAKFNLKNTGPIKIFAIFQKQKIISQKNGTRCRAGFQ